MKTYLYILFLLLMMQFGCRPLPEEQVETPVFSTVFSLNSGSTTLTGGVGGYYMFTRYITDNQDIGVSVGAFAPDTCTGNNCKASLQFEFRNLDGNTPLLDSLITPKELFYSYMFDSLQYYKINVKVENPEKFTSFLWRTGFSESTAQEWTIDVFDQEPKWIELTAYRNDTIKSRVSRLVSPLGLIAPFPKVGIIAIKSDTIDGYLINGLVDVDSIGSINWNTQAPTLSYYWQGIIPGILGLEVLSPEGYSGKAEVFNLSGEMPDTLETAQFSANIETISNVPPNYGAVAIQYIDGNGTVWRSDLGIQPNAIFVVEEWSRYLTNENGRPTVKLKVTYNCLLYNALGENMPIAGSGVIAVGLP